MKIIQFLGAVALAGLLSACGSGGSANDDIAPPVTRNEVPASALTSAKAYTSFAGTLSPSDSAAAVDVNNVTQAPTSETDAPMAI